MSRPDDSFLRTQMLVGETAIKKLNTAKVAVFGIGGVGSYAVEALARAGVGRIDLIDNDVICKSNINRQIYALNSTVDMAKVDVAKARILDINPNCIVNTFKLFFMPETADSIDFGVYDYVIDAIDTITGKKQIIMSAQSAGVPIISSMGAGNKLDATAFKIGDIYGTSVCPLARVMRRICKENGIEHLKVVYSTEPPLKPNNSEKLNNKQPPGSISFVPSVCGLIIAGEVIKDLIK